MLQYCNAKIFTAVRNRFTSHYFDRIFINIYLLIPHWYRGQSFEIASSSTFVLGRTLAIIHVQHEYKISEKKNY